MKLKKILPFTFGTIAVASIVPIITSCGTNMSIPMYRFAEGTYMSNSYELKSGKTYTYTGIVKTPNANIIQVATVKDMWSATFPISLSSVKINGNYAQQSDVYNDGCTFKIPSSISDGADLTIQLQYSYTANCNSAMTVITVYTTSDKPEQPNQITNSTVYIEMQQSIPLIDCVWTSKNYSINYTNKYVYTNVLKASNATQIEVDNKSISSSELTPAISSLKINNVCVNKSLTNEYRFDIPTSINDGSNLTIEVWYKSNCSDVHTEIWFYD